jgi:two-component system chemotaxis response regulator CheB
MGMSSHTAPPVVVVGASAGGVEALRDFVAALPGDLDACVLMVLHVPPTGASALPVILNRVGQVPARHASEGDPLVPGQILIAPPNHHLIVADGVVTLSRGPQENGHRPAIDVLFRSAARACGNQVIGVVLSGSLDDGAAGMVAITERGGIGLAQDYSEALYDAMPRAAALAANLDHIMTAKEIAGSLPELIGQLPGHAERAASTLMQVETSMADMDAATMHEHERPGEPSGFACPDCHGVLFRIQEGGLERYRCRVGHAWSPQSLIARQTVSLESALWMALRSLEEKAALSHDLGDRAAEQGHDLSALRFREGEQEALSAAELVRELVTGMSDNPPQH